MGFSIFAAGTYNFHFQQDGCIDQGTVDMVKTLAILQSMEPTKVGALGAAVDKWGPSADSTDLIGALAFREGLHNLKNAVDFIAMDSQSSDGWISLNCTEKRIVWVDTVRFAQYNFSPGDDPGTEFFRTIRNALVDTSLNDWGVILKLGEVIGRFSNEVDGSKRPLLNISITH